MRLQPPVVYNAAEKLKKMRLSVLLLLALWRLGTCQACSSATAAVVEVVPDYYARVSLSDPPPLWQ